MNPETQAHIFEPFFTTKEAGKGTGLGLATVHAIVMQSGGHISVDSQVGVGTTFTIYFPVSTASAATMKCLPLLRPTVAAAETILLVEDEQGLRKLMTEFLRAEGYTVIESADGPSARDFENLYRNNTPPTNRYDHAENTWARLGDQLREQRPGLKVLYITGYADPGTLQGGRVLEKPFMPEALLREIHDVLSSLDKFTTVRAG
jgi:two-component system, cell cycle sensor histidine kinase and response regulator CckA